MSKARYEIKPVQQYLDKPVIKRGIGGGFYYLYGYTRWQVCDTTTGEVTSDLYETRDGAAAAIRTWKKV